MKKVIIVSCFFLSTFLFGCKLKDGGASLFSGLPESALLTEIKTTLENKKPIVVAFTAEWCPHCRQYKPVFFEVKDLYTDKVAFINVDVDGKEGSAISERFQVKGIPTTAFIRQDSSVFKIQVGEIEKEKLIETADSLLKSKKKKRSESIAPFPIEIKEIAKPEEEAKPLEPKAEPTPVQQEESKEVKPDETLKQDETKQEIKEEIDDTEDDVEPIQEVVPDKTD